MNRTSSFGGVRASYIRSAFHDSGSPSDQPSSVAQRIWAAASLGVYSTETFKNSNSESTPCTQNLRGMMLQRSLGSARIFSMNGSNTLGSTSGSLSNVSLGRDDKPALFASKRSQKPGSAMQAAKRCSPLAARGAR